MKRILGWGSALSGSGGALLSAAASICCIGPAGIAILGVNGAIFAAGLKPYRVYLLGASLSLIAIALWITHRGAKTARRARCPTRRGRVARIIVHASALLWLAALVIQLLADRYWL